MNAAYQPVSCDLHSRLELAVMHRQTREWVWDDGHGEQRLRDKLLSRKLRNQLLKNAARQEKRESPHVYSVIRDATVRLARQ